MSLGLRPNTPAREIVEVATVATARFAGAEPGSGYRVTGVTHDSRAVRPGDLYAALPGFNTHGAEFVGAAVGSGASAILTDPAGADRAVRAGVPVLVVDDPRAALGGGRRLHLRLAVVRIAGHRDHGDQWQDHFEFPRRCGLAGSGPPNRADRDGGQSHR